MTGSINLTEMQYGFIDMGREVVLPRPNVVVSNELGLGWLWDVARLVLESVGLSELSERLEPNSVSAEAICEGLRDWCPKEWLRADSNQRGAARNSGIALGVAREAMERVRDKSGISILRRSMTSGADRVSIGYAVGVVNTALLPIALRAVKAAIASIEAEGDRINDEDHWYDLVEVAEAALATRVGVMQDCFVRFWNDSVS